MSVWTVRLLGEEYLLEHAEWLRVLDIFITANRAAAKRTVGAIPDFEEVRMATTDGREVLFNLSASTQIAFVRPNPFAADLHVESDE